MIVLPSVTKAQAERSYRTQVQLFETNKLQSKKQKNIKQQTRNQNNPKEYTMIHQRAYNTSTYLQHLSTILDKDLWQTLECLCVYALPECSYPLALAFISMVDLRSAWLACCPLCSKGTFWRCWKITMLIGWWYHTNVKRLSLVTVKNLLHAFKDP